MGTDSFSVTTDSLPLTRGAAIRGVVAALGAWLVGLAAATVAAGFVFGSRTLSSGALFLYNAHLVPLESVGGVTDAGGNAVAQMLGTLGLAVVVLPLVVLAVAGGLLAWRAKTASLTEAALAGLQVVPGYLACSVLGAIVITGPLFGGIYQPNLLLAALLAGVVFPTVGGSVGGVLGHVVGSAANKLRSKVR